MAVTKAELKWGKTKRGEPTAAISPLQVQLLIVLVLLITGIAADSGPG